MMERMIMSRWTLEEVGIMTQLMLRPLGQRATRTGILLCILWNSEGDFPPFIYSWLGNFFTTLLFLMQDLGQVKLFLAATFSRNFFSELSELNRCECDIKLRTENQTWTLWLIVIGSKTKKTLYTQVLIQANGKLKLIWTSGIRFYLVLEDLLKEICVCNKLPREFMEY